MICFAHSSGDFRVVFPIPCLRALTPSTRTPAAWLCFLMLARDLKTFSRALSRLRSKKARLEFAVAGSDKSEEGAGAPATRDWEDSVQQEAEVARDVAPSSRGAPPVDLQGTASTSRLGCASEVLCGGSRRPVTSLLSRIALLLDCALSLVRSCRLSDAASSLPPLALGLTTLFPLSQFDHC